LKKEFMRTIRGDTSVPEYGTLTPYFQLLRDWIDDHDDNLRLLQATRLSILSAARVRGDMKAFRRHHKGMLRHIIESLRPTGAFHFGQIARQKLWSEFGERLTEALPAEDEEVGSSILRSKSS
jgi:hypothetical protein